MDTRRKRRDRKRQLVVEVGGTVTGTTEMTRSGELTRTRIRVVVDMSDLRTVPQAFVGVFDIPAFQPVPEVGDKVSVMMSWISDPKLTEESE